LAEGLAVRGHSILVISENMTDEPLREVRGGVEILRLPTVAGYGPNVYDEPRLGRLHERMRNPSPPPLEARVAPALKAFDPDVMHTAVVGRLPQLWGLARQMGVPAVHTLRSYSALCTRRMMRRDRPCLRQCRDCMRSTLRGGAQAASAQVAAVVGISAHILGIYRDAGWFPGAHADVIGNSYESEARDRVLAIDPQDKPFDVGYIGRLHPSKGVAAFLQAAERMSGTRALKVVVTGTGNPDYVRMLRARYESERIVFTGYGDPADFFASTRICVVPSLWYEPFGRIFVEALYYGVPVLGSMRGGGAEVLTPETGRLFDPDDVPALAALLEEAVAMPPETYAAMSRAAVARSDSYSVEAIARRYEAVYEQVVGAGAEQGTARATAKGRDAAA
jgi:glycosyltransferase involved in cell wall biosynthesis